MFSFHCQRILYLLNSKARFATATELSHWDILLASQTPQIWPLLSWSPMRFKKYSHRFQAGNLRAEFSSSLSFIQYSNQSCIFSILLFKNREGFLWAITFSLLESRIGLCLHYCKNQLTSAPASRSANSLPTILSETWIWIYSSLAQYLCGSAKVQTLQLAYETLHHEFLF